MVQSDRNILTAMNFRGRCARLVFLTFSHACHFFQGDVDIVYVWFASRSNGACLFRKLFYDVCLA